MLRNPCSSVVAGSASRRCAPPPNAKEAPGGSTWGKHLEGVLLCWSAHQFQGPAPYRPGPLHQFATVGSISPDHPKVGESVQQVDQYQPSAVPVLYIGGMHHHRQQQSQGIHHDMPLASGYPLARVVASGPPFSVVFTDWLSMIAALGLARRPCACRRVACQAWCARCQVPSRRQMRK